MITLKSCPNCGSLNFILYRVITDANLNVEIISGVKIDAVVVVRYRKCSDCDLIFQNPRMSDKELDKYYGTGYYRRTINPPPEGMDKGEENRAKVDTEIIKKHIGKVRSHLDIGCGRGYLLKAVGADIKVGVESNTSYVKTKGIKVYSEINQVPDIKFDLVTAIHVLEHLSHPLDYMKRAAKFLDKGGHFVVEVPSWKTRGGPLGLVSLFCFEPDVLKLMSKQVGLEVIHMEFTPHLILICKKND